MGAIYEQTPNLGLDLYGDKDPADLRDGHNANMRKLDAAVKANIDAIGNKPSLSDVYTKDQINALYPSYPSFNDLKTSEKPQKGQIVHVDGFSQPSDGGAAYWEINDSKQSGKWNIDIANGLTATLVDSPSIRPESLGNPDDWSEIFNYLCSNSTPYSPVIELTGGAHYYVSSTVNVTKTMHVKGNGCVIESTAPGDAFTVNIATDGSLFGTWEWITFKCVDSPCVFHIVNAFKGRFAHNTFIGFTKTAVKHDKGYEMIFADLRFEGSTSSIASVGIELVSGDCSVSDIILRDCHTGLKISSSVVNLTDIHGWILTRSLINGSIMIDCLNQGIIFGDYIYNDTYQYGVFVRHGARINFTHFFQYFNANIWGNPSVDGTPSESESIHYENDNDSKFTSIQQASLRAAIDNLDAKFTASTQWLGSLSVTDWYRIDFGSIKFSQDIEINPVEGVSVADGSVVVRDNIAYINLDLKLQNVASLNHLFSLKPFMAEKRVITNVMFTKDAWVIDANPKWTTAVIDKYASSFTMRPFQEGNYTGFLHIHVDVPMYLILN